MNNLLAFVLFLLPLSFAQADEYFKIKCQGENNNDVDFTLTVNANLNVRDQWIRDDGEGKGARWIRVAELQLKELKVYSNTPARSKGEQHLSEIPPLTALGTYRSRVSDENENGIPDSILRFFEYSFTFNGKNYWLSATNQGQGGKKNYVLHLNSQENSVPTVAWTYCKLGRRW